MLIYCTAWCAESMAHVCGLTVVVSKAYTMSTQVLVSHTTPLNREGKEGSGDHAYIELYQNSITLWYRASPSLQCTIYMYHSIPGKHPGSCFA